MPVLGQGAHLTCSLCLRLADRWLISFSRWYWLCLSDPKFRLDTPSRWFWVRLSCSLLLTSGNSWGSLDHVYEQHQWSTITLLLDDGGRDGLLNVGLFSATDTSCCLRSIWIWCVIYRTVNEYHVTEGLWGNEACVIAHLAELPPSPSCGKLCLY